MIDHKSPPDGCPRMYLDARHGSIRLAHQPREKRMSSDPQAVGEPMQSDGVESRIQEQHLGNTSGRRVTVEDGLDILAKSAPKAQPPSPGPAARIVGCVVLACHDVTRVMSLCARPAER
jgi:hypothetical protein